ncbi:MAG: hypothetical protein AB7L84_14350 [Acidimicrobiia bacterium]
MASKHPDERKLIASIAANHRWAHEDPTEHAERARQNIETRFDDEVDPDRVLDPADRAIRAKRAKTAYFKTLALRSAQARRRKAS